MSKRGRKKQDNIEVKGKLDNKNFKQNPNWYFKDAVQADVLSRIQMNAFGAITKMGTASVPTVCAYYLNPCPGVTVFGDDDGSQTPGDPWDSQSKGVNRAAQKLWYLLTCKSGRAAGYTKADVALLLLAIGSMIETYEFIRRAFGISYTYNQRNRALPTMLYQAMCVDMQDYQANSAVYLKRMNSLMAIMNQLPIPGNVAWFAKCQDIFQNIYMDYPAEMAQLFVFSPSTTWILEENDGFGGGSYLRTVDMCIPHEDGSWNVGTTFGGGNITQTDWNSTFVNPSSSGGCRHLSDYIDVFEEQINNLLFSSSFSQIYSDILRAFDNGTLSRWSFDYIDEKYNIAPVFDDNRLWMIHNATVASGWLSKSRGSWQSNWFDSLGNLQSYDDIFKYGTPLNDVYQWATTDTVVYNPMLRRRHIGTDTLGQVATELLTKNYALDFPNDNPSVEERIEFTRYAFNGANKFIAAPFQLVNDGIDVPFSTWNLQLPDHWIEVAFILTDAQGSRLSIGDFAYESAFGSQSIFSDGLIHPASPAMWSKFHHGTISRRGVAEPGSSNWFYIYDAVYGELTSWTTLSSDWFNSINEMIYVDLFDIR